jgi:hypothetical protein
MACNVNFNEVLNVFGNQWMSSDAVVRAVRKFNHNCFPEAKRTHINWERYLVEDNLKAIVRVTKRKYAWCTPWCLFYKGLVYDPLNGVSDEFPKKPVAYIAIWKWPWLPDKTTFIVGYKTKYIRKSNELWIKKS